MNIVFVCLGNICRSPMAEFLLKRRLENDRIYGVNVESRATSNYEIGNNVHFGTQKILNNFGIDCSMKKSERLKKDDINKFDFIIGMDSNNIFDILNILNSKDINIVKNYYDLNIHKSNIFRFLDITDEKRDIKDPYYTGNFEQTYKDIEKGLDFLLKFIKENV